MAQKYYNTADAAKVLGKSVDEIKQMLERHELHGYRDGADWKFKVEDIDGLVKDQPAKPAEEGGDVLLSEVALGQSDPGLSGTVIGMSGAGGRLVTDSDVRLAESDLKLDESSKGPGAKRPAMTESKFEELDLTLEDDLTLQDSTLLTEDKKPAASRPTSGGSSFIDLGGKEDDDLVLGGSGTGSDVTLGGDSGISLVDPSDSGLSLETPVNLGAAAEESLELGEDEPAGTTSATASADSSTQLKTDDDFLLTPLEETTDIDDSESGSQVIALDTEAEAGMMAGGVSMASMLDEDMTTQPLDMGMAAPLAGTPVLGTVPGALTEGATLQPTIGVYEQPYSGWQLAGLVVCALLLLLCGMITYDLLRNMWSWEGAYSVNSQLMDTVLGWVGER
jgi:excisionase family DNA binding protein